MKDRVQPAPSSFVTWQKDHEPRFENGQEEAGDSGSPEAPEADAERSSGELLDPARNQSARLVGDGVELHPNRGALGHSSEYHEDPLEEHFHEARR